MTELTADYLGMQLRSPLVASAGPYTSDLDRLRELESAGIGAVVLPSLFEEQIEHETTDPERWFPTDDDRPGGSDRPTDAYLTLVESARGTLDVPVVASLSGTNLGAWLRFAPLLADAGADAIELNLYTVAADPRVSGPALESEQLAAVAALTDEVPLPVAVKISPYYSSLAAFLVGLQDAGASGVVMFNRFYSPDLDLQTLEMRPKIALSTSAELLLPLRWIGIGRSFLDISIAGSTGVHGGQDAAKLILAGANVAMMTSALLFHGTAHVAQVEQELRDWMRDHGYRQLREMRGAASRDAAVDPTAYERAHHVGNITSFTSRFLSSQRANRPPR